MPKLILDMGAFEVPHPVTDGATLHVPYIRFTSGSGQEWQFIADTGIETQDEAVQLIMEFAHYLETRPSSSKQILPLRNQDMN